MDNLNSEIDNVKQALNISDLTAQVREREREIEILYMYYVNFYLYVIHGPIHLM